MEFSYEEFITRNIGFVSHNEQEVLRKMRVFVPGVGGMGGVAVACLARAGVGNFIIADIDHFEISNLNRQIFSSLDVIGKNKAEVSKKILENINPEINIEIRDANWANELDEILKKTDIVINGCDDIKATILLMRKCKEYRVPAIDAFASPLPNVYVVRPYSKRPEEIFEFPSVDVPVEKITKEMEAKCLQKEVEYIATHSSSLNYIDLNMAKEIINGTRKRISFSPMVWTTGCMMAQEAVRLILNKAGGPEVLGVFFNPWTYKIEKPKNWLIALFRKYYVRRIMSKL